MISAAIIAGGKSSRMGRDKAFIEIDGQPMWQRQQSLLRQLGITDILISANADQSFPRTITTVRDTVHEQGPLAGLAACLRQCKNDHLLAIAVDMPNLDAPFLQLFIDAKNPLIFQNDTTGYIEPFPGLYPKSAADIAEQRLQNDDLSLQSFIREIAPHIRPIADPHYFQNWNTPEEIITP
jgi:molybdopterin-guanine dinucleotide biosynthesis protein A